MRSLAQRLNRPVVAILAVAVIAGAVRLWGLSNPGDLVFDEVYYAKSGCVFIGGSDQTCLVKESAEHYWVEHKWDMGSWVHPPLGKWVTGMGIKAFGMDSFGWRFPSAVAGTLIAVMVAAMAQLLFARPVWTFIAGTLVGLDGLNVVMSRVAMLDIHLAFWVVLGFLCLVLDRRWIDRRTEQAMARADAAPQMVTIVGEDGSVSLVGGRAGSAGRGRVRVPSPLWRPWRFGAGAALGAACAVKWSGLTALAAAVPVTLIWETTRRHRDGVSRRRAFWRTLGMETLGLVLAFLLVPIVVYMVTWLPWFNHFGWNLAAWWDNHEAMWRYHRELTEFAYDEKTDSFTPTHGSYSKAWTWLIVRRPVNFFVENTPGHVAQILTVGNLALFIGTVFAIPFAAWSWARTRDWRAGFVVVPFLTMWLPWFVVSRPQFFFYALPMTPFMALAATYTLNALSDARLVLRDDVTGEVALDPETGEPAISTRHPYRPLVGVYLAVFVALFVWFWPLMVGSRLTRSFWGLHIWMRSWN